MSYTVTRQLFKGRQRLYRACERLMSTGNEEKDNAFLQRQEGVPEYMPDDRDFEGGTHVNMLSEEAGDTTYILKFSSRGFTLKSGLKIDGPCVFFPRSFLSWKVSGVEDVNSDSLSLFSTIHPKPDLVVLGMGNHGNKVDPNILRYLREKKINFEILPTEQAIATFNFLNAEQRWVAAGMIPPTYTPSTVREEMQARLAKSNAEDYLTDDEEDEMARLEMEKQREEEEKRLSESLKEIPDKNMFGFPILKPAIDMAPEKVHAESDVKVVGEKRTVNNKSGNASNDRNSTNKDGSKT